MKNSKSKSILTLLVSLSLTLLIIITIFNSLTLYQQYQRYSQTVSSEAVLRKCYSLFQVVRHYGFERGRVNVVLNFKGPSERIQPSIDFLRQHRTDGDHKLKDTLKSLQTLPGYESLPVIEQITKTQEEIDRLRERYEAQFLLPFQDRDSELDDLWFQKMSQQIRQISFLIFAIKQQTGWSKGQKPLSETAYLLSKLRDHAGPVASYLKAASFNIQSLTDGRIEEIRNRKDVAEEYLSKLIFIASEILTRDSLAAVRDFRHQYFEVFYPLAQRYMETVLAGRPNPQLEKNYLDVGVKVLEQLNSIGIALEQACTTVSKEVIAEQLRYLLIGIIVSIIIFLIIFYSIYLLYRRMYLRVIDSARKMDQLTHGNLGIDIKPSGISDEIGLIEKGLQKFKENLQTIIQSNEQLKKEIEERIKAETEREYLEAQLRQKHKMEAVGYIAGGVAHNFNNDLSIILGSIELAELKGPKFSEMSALLEKAKKAVYHSRDLIKKIMAYSQKEIQQKAPVQLSSIIEHAVGFLQSTQPATVNFIQEIHPESTSAIIFGDPLQLHDVLVDLCENSIQAMAGEGDLKISLEKADIHSKDIPAQYSAKPGPFLKLSVGDTGHGMSREMLDKIFDPFFTTKGLHEGAGMGLATVQGIVSQHGGMITVSSVPRQGSIFELYFPIQIG